MDYFVPHFGRDTDIINTFKSLDVAENIRDHQWKLNPDWKKKPEDPITYDFNMDLDDDIIMTNEHMKAAEKNLKHTWNYKALQLDGESINYEND